MLVTCKITKVTNTDLKTRTHAQEDKNFKTLNTTQSGDSAAAAPNKNETNKHHTKTLLRPFVSAK